MDQEEGIKESTTTVLIESTTNVDTQQNVINKSDKRKIYIIGFLSVLSGLLYGNISNNSYYNLIYASANIWLGLLIFIVLLLWDEPEIRKENEMTTQEQQQQQSDNLLSSSTSSIVSSSSRSNSKSPDISQIEDEKVSLMSKITLKEQLEVDGDNDEIEEPPESLHATPSALNSSTQTLYKRSNVRNIISSLYALNNSELTQEENDENVENDEESQLSSQVVVEGYLDILPSGASQKNSILLTWKKRYFRLHLGSLFVYEDKPLTSKQQNYLDVYNLMGGKVEYENNRVICVDDSRGNCLIVRAYDDVQYAKWKNAFDTQVIDRTQSLWMRPKQNIKKQSSIEKKVVIIDLGTCSVRAGIYSNQTNLPTLFFPNVCSKDLATSKYKVGFDAFNTTNDSPRKTDQLIFPLKSKNVIDKLGIDMDCVDAIVDYVIKALNVNSSDYNVLIVTPQKFGDKVNVSFINMLLDKYNFTSVTLLNQALLVLYAYSSNTGVVVDLGEKVDVLPIANGITFQSGVTNLSYGASMISEYLNSFISRAHYNYVNDIEQYLVRFVKEKACYVAFNYNEELKKSRDQIKYSIDLNDYDGSSKKVELDSPRFQAPEGLFNPEVWGIDGQGIHKLIVKAIQSCSMDLRREMAKNIYLAGGMSRIPGLVERLEKEIKTLLPPSIIVKVNCSPFSYHCSYLGAFKFIEQPEYEKLLITKQEWSKENVNCLRKWRMV